MFMMVFGKKYRYSVNAIGLFAVLLSCVLILSGCRRGGPGAGTDAGTSASGQTSMTDVSETPSGEGGNTDIGESGGADTDVGQSSDSQTGTEASQPSESEQDAANDTKKVYIRDIAYVSGDRSRTLDVMYEKDGTIKPVLLLVHGGSYIQGDKIDMIAYQNYYHKKYVTVSINYPLVPNATMVSQYRCVEQALDFLSEHAQELDADMQNVVVLGFSAGAQLAVRACEEITLRISFGEELPYSVVGIIDNAGPTDETVLAQTSSKELVELATAYPEVIDGVKDSSIETEYSKIDCTSNIVRGMMPILILHGTDDTKVDYQVSVAFYEALKEQDVDVTFKLFEGQPHGADLALVIPCIDEFLDKVLG